MDHTCRVTFWDETGRPIEEILDLGCSSDFCTTKRYDYNQDLRLQFEDNSCDGTPNSGCTAEGLARSGERPLETDYDCDGVVDSCRREERDAYGNLVRSYEDENCDGTADFFCTDYLYSSPPEGHLPEYP